MGADIKQLRIRIKSVDSTMHLTKAMGLVASSKIRRATEAKAATLTTKKLQSIFEQERKERAAKKAEKEARKAARTSGK